MCGEVHPFDVQHILREPHPHQLLSATPPVHQQTIFLVTNSSLLQQTKAMHPEKLLVSAPVCIMGVHGQSVCVCGVGSRCGHCGHGCTGMNI